MSKKRRRASSFRSWDLRSWDLRSRDLRSREPRIRARQSRALRHPEILLLAVLLVLGIWVPGAAADDDGASTFFVGRLAFGGNHGDDCGDVGQDLVRLVERASTIRVREEKRMSLRDPGIFETPFLFMNGHADFVLSEEELENLRRYLERGGFVFASGCCTNPAFPDAWRRELSRLFRGERVRKIPYEHLIYRSFYKLERIRSANGDRDVYLEGLFYEDELVAVLGEDGLCCGFAMDGSCNIGQGVSADDAKKAALNVGIYALTH